MHESLVILIEVRQAQCQSLVNWLGPGLSCGVNEESTDRSHRLVHYCDGVGGRGCGT